ncbi:SCF complex assembly, partial [Dipsacomyces acuminosporus]
MVSRECQEFLDKLNNSDPDNRLMAISDVSTMLKSLQTNLSKEDSKQYTTALVSKLTDGHTHVEAEATSCLGQLLKFIDNDAATSTIEGICTSMAKAEFGTKTGTLSAALRIVVGQLPDSVDSKGMVAGLAKPITATLAKVPAKASYDIKVDLIDALAEILVRAGGYMSSSNNLVDDVQGILLAALNDASAAVRRRAISALGKFIISVPEEFSNKALNEIFERYSKSSDKNEANKYLRILVLIIRQTPLRIANLVQIVIDRELSTLETVEESERELRITSLSAFETILNECPELAKGKIEQIYDAAISALNYDPNYSYDDNSDDDDENGMDEDGDEDSEDFEDEFDDDIYADDEDDSWEIRMSAVKLLTALIGSGLFTAEAIISRIGTSLVSSFREREDVVRAEILIAFANMLVKTKELASKSQESDMDVEDTLVDQLAEQTPQIVNSLLSAIKSYPKSTETKQLAFVIFRRLVAINKPILRGLLSKIAPQVQGALGAKDSSSSLQSASTKLVKPNLKLDALDFLLELTSCDSLTSELRDFIESLKDCVSASIQSANFLVPSAALDVVSQFLVLLRTAADNDGIDTAP